MSLNKIINRYREILIRKKDELLSLLVTVETIQAAEDEWQRAMTCFDEIDSQLDYLSAGKVELVASFLPLNQPLYSFVLFVAVPSLTSKSVVFRPPVLLWELFSKISTALELHSFDNVSLCEVSRKDFLTNFASKADVVIFTGDYDNVESVSDALKKNALLLFNGGALNPIIITDSADIKLSAHNVAQERLFNSGQDCMAPAGILLNRKIANEFLRHLLEILKKEVVGDSTSAMTTIGQMLDVESVYTVNAMLSQFKDNLYYGGNINETKRFIEPTVFLFDSVRNLPQRIIFAPVFFIGIFDKYSEIDAYLSTDIAKELDGYLSVYSTDKQDIIALQSIHKQVLVNESLFNYEKANKAFGGYGHRCSFTSINGALEVKPLLISEEIANAFYNYRRI